MQQSYITHHPGAVFTVHILNTGEIISNVEEYMKFEDRFEWVDRKFIIEKMLHLRQLTDEEKRSVIVIYEDGQKIREFVNVEHSFKPLAFC
ncbi:MAG TPA: hypothetical protein VKR53_05880 [Puia sp.]|nr:hypothetical protein [Puia sp.]